MRDQYLPYYPACPWSSTNTSEQTYYDDVYRTCTLECPSNPMRYKSADTTLRTCLQHCDGTSYALATTKTCTATCPNYYFINNTLTVTVRQCVSPCPNNTYIHSANNQCVVPTGCPASTYANPVTGTCSQYCSSVNGVQMFADTNANRRICVYVCPTGFYQQNESNAWLCVSGCISNRWIDYVSMACVATCPSGSYSFSNGSCVSKCSGSLYADPFTRNCSTSCSNSYFSDPSSSTCVSLCPPGYFGDITGGYKCTQTCSVATEFGNPLTRLCVTKANCPSPYIYADNHTRTCVSLCPSSQSYYADSLNLACVTNCPWNNPVNYYTYKDPSTQRCVTSCPSNPSYFRDTTTQTCVNSCPSPYFAVASTRLCDLVCPPGFFEDNLTRTCVSTCQQDPNPFYYFTNTTSNSNECVQFCPLATLADPTTMSCITTTCPTNPSLFAYNNTCIAVCPENYYQYTPDRTCESSCPGAWLKDPSTRRCVQICPISP